MNQHTEYKNFKDRMVTVDETGKRKWIFPKMPKGKLYNYRTWLSYFNLIVLFGLPWVTFNGHPFVLLNIIERKFILFGQIFWPQDFWIFAIVSSLFWQFEDLLKELLQENHNQV